MVDLDLGGLKKFIASIIFENLAFCAKTFPAEFVSTVRTIRIEIRGKDEFWGRAFHVEWADQFPDRKLRRVREETYAAQEEWLADIERIAAECLCRVVRAPELPERRSWLKLFTGPIRPK